MNEAFLLQEKRFFFGVCFKGDLSRMKNKKLLTVICTALAISIFTFSGCNGRGTPDKKPAPPTPVVKKAPVDPVVKKAKISEPKEETFQTTLVSSSGIGKKAPLPAILKNETEFRPIVSIGKESIRGTGTADNEKLDKLRNCISDSVIVDPDIFKGLSDMQVIALREAIADAVKKSEADFLLAPRWEFSVRNNNKETEISCTVIGYPAKITGFEEISLVKQELDLLKKQLSEKKAETLKLNQEIEALKEVVKEKDVIIAALNKKVATPTRSEVMETYLKLIKDYNLKDMNDIRKILAIMGEGTATSEVLSAPSGITVKPGDVTLKSTLDVAVPVEIPAVQVKLVD